MEKGLFWYIKKGSNNNKLKNQITGRSWCLSIKKVKQFKKNLILSCSLVLLAVDRFSYRYVEEIVNFKAGFIRINWYINILIKKSTIIKICTNEDNILNECSVILT